MTSITNNPITSHPLADQATWWDDDKSIKEVEAMRNHKAFLPAAFPSTKPYKIFEGGVEIYPTNGNLSQAAKRTVEGVQPNFIPTASLGR